MLEVVCHCGFDSPADVLGGVDAAMSLQVSSAPIAVLGGDEHCANGAGATTPMAPPPDSPRRSSPFYSYLDVCWCCPSCIERRQRARSQQSGQAAAAVVKETGTELLCCHGLPITNGFSASCRLCAYHYGIVQMNNPHLNAFFTLPLQFLRNGVSTRSKWPALFMHRHWCVLR